MFFQSKNQHAAKKAICWTSKYFWNHRIVQPIVRKDIVIAWIESEKKNLEFNVWIVWVESIFFWEVPTLDTFPSVVLIANLPHLENEIKYNESSDNKYDICICFHICCVIILMIERYISWFCPSPFEYGCSNCKKWLDSN